MEKTFDVICMGEICQDMLMSGISLDELVRPGGTAIADEYISARGGDAANEASVLSRLGNRVAFLGRTGTDSQGDFLVDSLKRAGVDTSLVIRKEGCHNIISVCVTKTDHSHSFLVVKGTDALLTFSDVDLSGFDLPLESAEGMIRTADQLNRHGKSGFFLTLFHIDLF